MRMAKVWEEPAGEHPAGWYYMFNMNQPVGPFATRVEAEAALSRAAAIVELLTNLSQARADSRSEEEWEAWNSLYEAAALTYQE